MSSPNRFALQREHDLPTSTPTWLLLPTFAQDSLDGQNNTTAG
ncbi:MAG TPA: hypothetical protein VIV60_23665 [Polyangiaceae bacterium]